MKKVIEEKLKKRNKLSYERSKVNFNPERFIFQFDNEKYIYLLNRHFEIDSEWFKKKFFHFSKSKAEKLLDDVLRYDDYEKNPIIKRLLTEEQKIRKNERNALSRKNFNPEKFISQFDDEEHLYLLKEFIKADREWFIKKFYRFTKTSATKFLKNILNNKEKSYEWEFLKVIRKLQRKDEKEEQKSFDVEKFINSFDNNLVKDFLKLYYEKDEKEFREKYFKAKKSDIEKFCNRYFWWRAKAPSIIYKWTLWIVQKEYYYKTEGSRKEEINRREEEKQNKLDVTNVIGYFSNNKEQYDFMENFLKIDEKEFRKLFYKMTKIKTINYVCKYLWDKFIRLNFAPRNKFWELLKSYYYQKRIDFLINNLKLDLVFIEENPHILKVVSDMRKKANEFRDKLWISYTELGLMLKRSKHFSFLWRDVSKNLKYFKEIGLSWEEVWNIIKHNERAWNSSTSIRIKECRELWLKNSEIWDIYRRYNTFFISNTKNKTKLFKNFWITPIAFWRVINKFPNVISVSIENKIRPLYNLNIYFNHSARNNNIVIENIEDSYKYLDEFSEKEMKFINKAFEEDFLIMGVLILGNKKKIYEDYFEHINRKKTTNWSYDKFYNDFMHFLK